jgi:predicted GIY-YIG superfamily endonuclease
VTVEGVYLIHFDKPLGHAAHYIGWAKNIQARLSEHEKGIGAKLTAAVKDNGISWELARTWPGEDRKFERSLKNRHSARELCPICRKAFLKKKRLARRASRARKRVSS